MRLFVAILVLILSIQSWTKADDISDFEIEGVSIGDSGLIYATKKELDEKKRIGLKIKNIQSQQTLN